MKIKAVFKHEPGEAAWGQRSHKHYNISYFKYSISYFKEGNPLPLLPLAPYPHPIYIPLRGTCTSG